MTVYRDLKYELENNGEPVDVGFLFLMLFVLFPFQLIGVALKKMFGGENA